MTARHALADATARIAAVSPTPRLDAELLMAHAMGVTRDRLLLTHLDDPAPPAFVALVEHRMTHEPVAYITGTRGFWTIDLCVGPGALVPRADSETLIDVAVAHFAGSDGPRRILDLGTGPGTLLLAALDQWPGASGVGVDASDVALAMARGNAERLGMTARATFATGNWAEGIDGPFDLVLANPPYIATDEILPREVADHEPPSALFAGADGLDAYRVIIPALPRLIAPGGIAVIEIGATQGDAVAAMVQGCGLATAITCDLGGNPRVVAATRPDY